MSVNRTIGPLVFRNLEKIPLFLNKIIDCGHSIKLPLPVNYSYEAVITHFHNLSFES